MVSKKYSDKEMRQLLNPKKPTSAYTSKRAKDISSLTSSIAKLKNDTDRKITMAERYGSDKDINKVQSSMTKILSNLNNTIGNLATGVKDITLQTAKASKDIVSEYGRAISQDVSINKQSFLTMALSKTSPIFGYFAAKLTETSMFKRFTGGIKSHIKSAMTGIGSHLKSGIISIFTGAKDKAKEIHKRSKEPSLGKTVSNVVSTKRRLRAAKIADTPVTYTDVVLKNISAKLSNLDKVPKMDVGGYVEKEGLARVHPAEVIMPIEKVLDRIDNKNIETKEMVSSITTLNKNFIKADINRTKSFKDSLKDIFHLVQLTTFRSIGVVDQSLRRQSGWFQSFIDAYKSSLNIEGDYSKRSFRVLNSILETLGGQITKWRHMWTQIIIDHPIIRSAVLSLQLLKKATSLTLSPLKFLFKARGGYKGDLPTRGSVYEQIANTLGLIYTTGMTKLDNIILYSKKVMEASQAISGKQYDDIKEQDLKTGRWSIFGKMIKGLAFPIEKLIQSQASEKTAGILTGDIKELIGNITNSITGSLKAAEKAKVIEEVKKPNILFLSQERNKILKAIYSKLSNVNVLLSSGRIGQGNLLPDDYTEEYKMVVGDRYTEAKTPFGKKPSGKLIDLEKYRKRNKSIEEGITNLVTIQEKSLKTQTKFSISTSKKLTSLKKTLKNSGKQIWKWLIFGLTFLKSTISSFLSPITALFTGGAVGFSSLLTKGVLSLFTGAAGAVGASGIAGVAIGTLLNKYLVNPLIDAWYKRKDRDTDKAYGKSRKGLLAASEQVAAYRRGEVTREEGITGVQNIKMLTGIMAVRKKRERSYHASGSDLATIQYSQEAYMNKHINEYLKYGYVQVNQLREEWINRRGGGYVGIARGQSAEDYGEKREAAFLQHYLKVKGTPTALIDPSNLKREGVGSKFKGAITDIKSKYNEHFGSNLTQSELAIKQAHNDLAQAQYTSLKNQKALDDAAEKQATKNDRNISTIINNISQSFATHAQNIISQGGEQDAGPLTSKATTDLLTNQICAGTI